DALDGAGGSRERLAALRSGRAAGALLNAPQDALAEAAGFVRLAKSAEIVGRYQGSVGAARRPWAAANVGALVRFIRAYVAAVDWLYDPANRAEAMDILRRRLADVSPDNAARSYDELLHPSRGSLSRKAAIDPEGVRTVLALRREFARPARPLSDPGRYYDLTYYERALRQLHLRLRRPRGQPPAVLQRHGPDRLGRQKPPARAMAPLHARGLVRHPRILAEDERLDGHRHRMGRHADAAEIDEVEVAQRDAVEHQDFRTDAPLLLEDGAEGLRDVPVEHDVDRVSMLDGVSQAKRDRASKG